MVSQMPFARRACSKNCREVVRSPETLMTDKQRDQCARVSELPSLPGYGLPVCGADEKQQNRSEGEPPIYCRGIRRRKDFEFGSWSAGIFGWEFAELLPHCPVVAHELNQLEFRKHSLCIQICCCS